MTAQSKSWKNKSYRRARLAVPKAAFAAGRSWGQLKFKCLDRERPRSMAIRQFECPDFLTPPLEGLLTLAL